MARAEQAQLASRWAGRPVSPLADAEADALAPSIDTAGPAPVVILLPGLQAGLGEESAGLPASPIAPRPPELAAAPSPPSDRPLVARALVLRARAAPPPPHLPPA